MPLYIYIHIQKTCYTFMQVVLRILVIFLYFCKLLLMRVKNKKLIDIFMVGLLNKTNNQVNEGSFAQVILVCLYT